MEVRLKDFVEFRREKAERSYSLIRELMNGDSTNVSALLAEFKALQRENDELRRENDELRKRVFRLNEDLPGEEWRDVVGYEGLYRVSNFGRVKSFCKKTPKILNPAESYEGYLRVGLHKNGKIEYLVVQRLVAKAFISNPDGKPFVNHIDGNKANNRVENLEWVTQSENVVHAYRTGLSKGPGRKLTTEQVFYIRENPDGLTDRELAEMFGVSVGTVRHARVGINYKYLK